MDRISCRLEFTEVTEGSNLYDDYDLSKGGIVEARYVRRVGYEDDPDVCAVPVMPSMTEIIDSTNIQMRGFGRDAVRQMAGWEKNEALIQMRGIFYPLGHHIDLARAVNELLVASYKGRSGRLSVHNQGVAGCNTLSLRDTVSPRPDGFRMIGDSGTGKSVGMAMIQSMYPKAIRHSFPGIDYIQIPIITVTALVSNLTEVYRSIATKLDEILDTGVDHASMVRTADLGKCAGYIKRWIKVYHIGMIVIDEIQFLRLDTSNSSFENIVSISEETGCAFGIIGNPEAEKKITEMSRIQTRTANHFIAANAFIESNRAFFEYAVEDMWKYQFGDVYHEMTEDIRQALINETEYNIALLKVLVMHVQKAILKKRPKTVDGKFIHDVAGKRFEKLRKLISRGDKKSERQFKMEMNNALDALDDTDEITKQKINAVKMVNEKKKEEAVKVKIYKACDTLLNCTDFTESQITRAVDRVIADNRSLRYGTVKEIVYAASEFLKKHSRKAERKLSMLSSQRDDRMLDEEAEVAVREKLGGIVNG